MVILLSRRRKKKDIKHLNTKRKERHKGKTSGDATRKCFKV